MLFEIKFKNLKISWIFVKSSKNEPKVKNSNNSLKAEFRSLKILNFKVQKLNLSFSNQKYVKMSFTSANLWVKICKLTLLSIVCCYHVYKSSING